MWLGRPAIDVEFGLGADAYVFIGADHFWEHDYGHFYYGRERLGYFYGRSLVHNGYRFEGGRFHVEGMGRERLGAFTHHEIRVERVSEIRAREERAHFETRRVEIEHRAVSREVAHRPEAAPQHAVPNGGPQGRAQAATPTHGPDHPAVNPGSQPQTKAAAAKQAPAQAAPKAAAPKQAPAQAAPKAAAPAKAPAAAPSKQAPDKKTDDNSK